MAQNFLGIDYGLKRVGIAYAGAKTKMPHPETTLVNDGSLLTKLNELVVEYGVGTIVVGMPRSLDGNVTNQTQATMDFCEQLRQEFSNVTIDITDEAASSLKATERLNQQQNFNKADIDAMAATIILEDYLGVSQ